jgi:tellurite resistance protein TerC
LRRIRYLHYGLAAVLALAGAKLVVTDWVHVHPLISVLAIALCIGLAVAASLLKRNGEPALDEPSASKRTT